MKTAIHALNTLEREGVLKRYAIGGAMGALFYVEPFTTFDLDVFVIVPQPEGAVLYTLDPLYRRLEAMGFHAEKECVIIDQVPVQFLPAYNPLLEEALQDAVDVVYEDVPTRVLSAEHLVAVSVQTGRAKDRMRIPMFQEANVLNIDKLQAILHRHVLMERWLAWTR
jgi:hypothetical protein